MNSRRPSGLHSGGTLLRGFIRMRVLLSNVSNKPPSSLPTNHIFATLSPQNASMLSYIVYIFYLSIAVAVGAIAYSLDLIELFYQLTGYENVKECGEEDGEDTIDPERAIIQYQLQQLYANKEIVADAIATQNDVGQPHSRDPSSADIVPLDNPSPRSVPSPIRTGYLHHGLSPRSDMAFHEVRTPGSHTAHEQACSIESCYTPAFPRPNYFSYPPPFVVNPVYSPPTTLQPATLVPYPSRVSLLSDFFVKMTSSITNFNACVPAFPTLDFSSLAESISQCNAALESFVTHEEEQRRTESLPSNPQEVKHVEQEYQPPSVPHVEDYDMEDTVMEDPEDADKPRNLDSVDMNICEDSSVVPTPLSQEPPTCVSVHPPYPNPRLQAAVQHQAALQQKLEALIDLQRQLQETYLEATHQSLKTWAQTTIGQAQEAVNAVEKSRNEYTPLLTRDHDCLRFWYQTIDEIKTQNHMTTTAISQEGDSRPQPDESTTPSPSSSSSASAREELENTSDSQASFLDSMLGSGIRRQSSGGDALCRYPAAQSRGETLTPNSNSSSSSTLSCDSSLEFRATASGGVERRGGETVVKGSEADIQFRVKWERKMDAKLKERIRRLRKEKEQEQAAREGDPQTAAAATSAAASALIPQSCKRKWDDIQVGGPGDVDIIEVDINDHEHHSTSVNGTPRRKHPRFRRSASLVECRLFKNDSRPNEYVGSELAPPSIPAPHKTGYSKPALRTKNKVEKKEKKRTKISSDVRRMSRSIMTVTRRTSSETFASL